MQVAFLIAYVSALMGSMMSFDNQIVVVVNQDNPVNSLNLRMLSKIYLGETTSWAFDGQKLNEIILLDSGNDPEKASKFYRRVLGLTQSRTRLAWIGKLLSGVFQEVPKKLNSDNEILKYVSNNRRSIGFVWAKNFKPNLALVKAVKIDGKNFDDESYPLR